MHTPQDYRDFDVLYVDDEAQALKYFKKAMDKDFNVVTAGNAAEATAIIDKSGDRIGIVICDQRMPGEKGTELLTRLRAQRPGIVRILTTAYSDLESAIEAVNSGAIYKYIVKPWDLRDLRGVLLRAMDFFLVTRQRDLLLREKLSVLQRMMVNDRIRGLAVLAAGLSHHIRNSMSALKAFLDVAPAKLADETPKGDLRNPGFWQDTWQTAQKESRRIIELVERVSAVVVHPSQEFGNALQLGGEIRAAADRLTATGKLADCKLDVPAAKNLPDIHVDRDQLARLFDIILQKATTLSGGKGTIRADIQPQAVHGTPGLRVSITGTGDGWANAGSEAMFSAISPGASDMGLELLSAFFIAHHHGGELRFAGGGFELLLPVDPQAVEVKAPDVSFLDELFDSFYLQNQGQPG